MNIKSLKIKELYNQFSYDINFLKNDIPLSIITGPNGYGKTTVLQIIDSISKGNFLYFYTFPFEKIEFEFTDEVFLTIRGEKLQNDEQVDEEIEVKQVNFLYKDESQKVINLFELRLEDILNIIPNHYRRNLEFRSNRENFIFSLIKLLEENSELKIYESLAKEQGQDQFLFFIRNFKSFFIPAQRLYYVEKENRNGYYNKESVEKKSSIEEVAQSMKNLLDWNRFQYLQNAQDHDNQFIYKYLSSSKEEYSETIFKEESEKLQTLIDELYSYKLINKIQLLKYDSKHRKILSVYLDDLKEKLEYYKDILDKLRIFSSILSEKMFTNKKIELSPDYGITIKLKDGTGVNINSLSSGEKNEIIMLYHLIFDVKENSVLLIDEPEISLHVSWQLEFLDDIEKIIENKKIQVIIATHSPQIINEKWDLCYDFFKNSK